MLTKKKRRMIKITIPVVLVILVIAILVALYLTTDMFKSDETLFFKYLGKNTENISEIQNILKDEEFKNMLETNNKYTENSEISVNYTENYGTTSENTDNILNKLRLKISGETDKENNYQYNNIELLNENDDSLKLEILKNNDEYQMFMPELFAKSIEIDDVDLITEKLGYNSEDLQKVENLVKLNIFEKLEFNEEELENLKNRYIDLIKVKADKNKFSKKSNQKIAINEKQFIANAYTLTMNKEEFNNLYIDILNELKNDEVILKKIENIQEIYDFGLQNIKKINFKEQYLNWIEETIDNINRTNIGTDEIRIIVYESKGETISTIIETNNYEIDFDNLHESEKFSEITIKNQEDKIEKIGLSKNGDTLKFVINRKENENSTIFEIEEKNAIGNTDAQKNTIVKYEDTTNRIEIRHDRKIEIVNNLELREFNNDNIVLDKLKESQLNEAIKTITENTLKKVNEVSKNTNIGNEIQKIFKNIGFTKEVDEIISEGTSESEKNRYNSRFEILKGENLSPEDILRIISDIGDNIKSLKVESNTKLKIEISGQEKNEDLVQKFKEFIEKNKRKKYNIDIEYNETTGLVQYIVLTIVEEKR